LLGFVFTITFEVLISKEKFPQTSPHVQMPLRLLKAVFLPLMSLLLAPLYVVATPLQVPALY